MKKQPAEPSGWEPPEDVVKRQLVRLRGAFAAFQLPAPPDHAELAAHRVSVLGREEDHTAVILAGMGFSNKAIMKRTGLSEAQISLRCKRARVSRRAYRDGESAFALAVMARAAATVGQLMTHHVRQLEAHKVPDYKKFIDI